MASSGVMKDSYVGGIVSSSCIQQTDGLPFSVTADEQQQTTDEIADDKIESILFGGKMKGCDMQRANQTDEDKIIHLTCTDEAKSTNINKTEEYNIGYSGLSILPWEEFICNPRAFNDLFYIESNQRITYDPEEVNVFFHGKNVMPPTIGDISENGKSWNIDVDNIADLRKVRKLLTERCSVFGVTLQYKEKRFAKPVRAPCLIYMDPHQGGIGDRLYTTLTKAMDTIHNQRRFCIEINLNECVERWCKRVLLTDCKAVGAKVFVTNGEEYTPLNETTEDKICCAVCFPVWLLQTCIYKLHRFVTYDDYRSELDEEDLFLHGSFQDARYQRQQIFKEIGNEEVFRTRSANQTNTSTLQALGSYKFVCVKKVEKLEDESTFKEHSTATFGALVDKRKEKVLHKDKKISEKKNSKKTGSDKDKKITFDLGNRDSSQDLCTAQKSRYDDESTDNNSKAHTNDGFWSSDDEHGENIEATPRIPEISSVLCSHDSYDSSEIEAPVNFEMGDDNMFIKTTDVFDQDAVDPRIQEKDCPDSKSMTAVCSFQTSDTGSEFEVSDEEEEEKVEVEVATSKDNLIEEMMKIERTLPKIKTISTDFDNKASNGNSETDKKGKKSKKKIMVGQAFREITKTTNSSVTKDKKIDDEKSEKSLEDKKSQNTNTDNQNEENDKLIASDKAYKETDAKNENKGKDNDENPVQHSNEAKSVQGNAKTEGDFGNDHSENQRDENINNSGMLKSDNAPNNSDMLKSANVPNNSQGNLVLDFNVDDSSTDGDDVEMIYQSQRSNYSVPCVKETSGSNCKAGLDIERTAEVNKPIAAKTAECETYETSKRIVKNTEKNLGKKKEVKDKHNILGNNELNDVTGYPDADRNKNSSTLLGVTKVETTLDITDIDDIDEDDHNEKPNIKIPPLKLNIGETLGKKAKRGSRQYNSNRKYLGASVPSKTKRMHKE